METLFRWSKLVEESQLEDWEVLFVKEQVSWVSEKSVKRSRWRLAVYTTTRAEAEVLRERFGGTVDGIDPGLWHPKPSGLDEKPLRIRGRLIVTASDDPAVLCRLEREHPEKIILSFPPQLAFGTGGHATTAACLRFLVDFARDRDGRPWSFLDLGCGSGILAVAAARLGANRVKAVENDAMALLYARDNAARHGVAEAVEFVEGDVVALMSAPPETSWDLIGANLFSDLLEILFPCFPAHLAEEGELIVSGFLASQAESVSRRAVAAGLPFRGQAKRGKWMAARSRKTPRPGG